MSPSQLAAETSVVIIDSLVAHPWLRELPFASNSATARPRIDGRTVVAFTTVRRRTDGGPYMRRCWLVRPRDPAIYGATDWPIEAVVPTSIAPARPSRSMGHPSLQEGPR